MGNDGGSIPKRRELVKEAARLQTASEAKESQQERLEWRWTTCALSQKPLRVPVVSDCAGNLYNKDSVLEFLLPSEDPSIEEHKADSAKVLGGRVRALKDVVEVRFQEEGAAEGDDGEGTVSGSLAARKKWVCPITDKQLGPVVKAVYIVPCGHAFSEVALKEVVGDSCLQCGENYTADNIVNVLPTSESDRSRLIKRMESLKEQGLSHSLKKASGSSKKRKKNAEANISNGASGVATSKGAATSEIPSQIGGAAPKASSGIKNAATASLTAKVLAEEQEKAKRRKLEGNDSFNSLFSSSEKQRSGNSADFMTRGFSIPTGTKR